jgi:6-pyruvoyltetrahydropterin/6-carboxytetrahydropterin synthase
MSRRSRSDSGAVYTIAKRFEFSASHQLDHLGTEHKCARIHGHNYTVELILSAETLDESDFIVDYGDLAPFRDYLREKIDHRHLNDVMPCRTTAENISKWLYDTAVRMWPQVRAVRVSETPGTWAEFRSNRSAERVT